MFDAGPRDRDGRLRGTRLGRPAGRPPRRSRARSSTETRDSALGLTEWKLSNGVRVIAQADRLQGATRCCSPPSAPAAARWCPTVYFLGHAFAATLIDAGGLGVLLRHRPAEEAGRQDGRGVESLHRRSYEEGVQGQGVARGSGDAVPADLPDLTAPREDAGRLPRLPDQLRAPLANRRASPQVAFQDTLAVTLTPAPSADPADHHRRDRLARPRPVARGSIATASRRRRLHLRGRRRRFQLDRLKPLVERYLGNLPATHRADAGATWASRHPRGWWSGPSERGSSPRARRRWSSPARSRLPGRAAS